MTPRLPGSTSPLDSLRGRSVNFRRTDRQSFSITCDPGERDLWSNTNDNGDFFFPTTPEDIYVSSEDALDDRMLFVQYLDPDYQTQVAAAILNGQTPVQVNTGAFPKAIRVIDYRILTDGANADNVHVYADNAATAGEPDDLTRSWGFMRPRHNRMNAAISSMPNGWEARIVEVWAQARRAGAEPESQCIFQVREFGKAWVAARVVQNDFGATIYKSNIYLPPKCDVRVRYFKTSGLAETVTAGGIVEAFRTNLLIS